MKLADLLTKAIMETKGIGVNAFQAILIIDKLFQKKLSHWKLWDQL
jgi:hypothetical protein